MPAGAFGYTFALASTPVPFENQPYSTLVAFDEGGVGSSTRCTSQVSPIDRFLFMLRVLWASPYTMLGLSIGGIGLCFGGRVRIRGRAIEFYDGGTKWFVQRLPHGQFTLALTLGHTILGQTDASLDISRKHEAVHVAQYERWGPFMLPAYFGSSIFMWLTGRRFYRENPFEREAYDVDGGEHAPSLAAGQYGL